MGVAPAHVRGFVEHVLDMVYRTNRFVQSLNCALSLIAPLTAPLTLTLPHSPSCPCTDTCLVIDMVDLTG